MPASDHDNPLARRMAALGIREEDLVEKFILGSGPGGQKLNKTASCVYLKHLPTGCEVKCQATRSRALNRLRARSDLCDLIETIARRRQAAQRQAAAKRRRQLRQRSQRSKTKSIADKRRTSLRKSLRRRPQGDD
jgi:protein subunit release factor B